MAGATATSADADDPSSAKIIEYVCPESECDFVCATAADDQGSWSVHDSQD
jgi:hypothetical protein